MLGQISQFGKTIFQVRFKIFLQLLQLVLAHGAAMVRLHSIILYLPEHKSLHKLVEVL